MSGTVLQGLHKWEHHCLPRTKHLFSHTQPSKPPRMSTPAATQAHPPRQPTTPGGHSLSSHHLCCQTCATMTQSLLPPIPHDAMCTPHHVARNVTWMLIAHFSCTFPRQYRAPNIHLRKYVPHIFWPIRDNNLGCCNMEGEDSPKLPFPLPWYKFEHKGCSGDNIPNRNSFGPKNILSEHHRNNLQRPANQVPCHEFRSLQMMVLVLFLLVECV